MMKSFPKNNNEMIDICVEKKNQFFKALYKAIQGYEKLKRKTKQYKGSHIILFHLNIG